MPRRARLALAGISWHIIQRGNNRTACFFTDEDYRRYLDTLGEMAAKFECAVQAYVLMTIHLNEVPLHIVQRGHNREPCFFSEEIISPIYIG